MRSYSRDKNVLLSVCSLFCGLDFVCALSFLRSSNKNVVLTQRYPKHAVLKVPISQPQQAETPSFAQHIFIGLATCHYSLRSPSLWLSLHTPAKLPQISPFSKFPLFGSCTRKSTFSAGPKIPFFNAPELDVY